VLTSIRAQNVWTEVPSHRMASTKFTLVIFTAVLCISSRAYCQRQPIPQSSVEIIECESVGCTPGQGDSPVWTFSSPHGIGRFGTGVQQVTVEHIDVSSIAVRRVDTNGPANGLIALYMGRIEGQRIIGSVLYYDRSHPDWPRNGVWTGVLRGSPASLRLAVTGSVPRFPFTLHECESNRCLQPGATKSIIWTFPSRNGQGWLGDHPRSVVIEDLTPGFLVARRIDGDALGGLTALYFGEIDGKLIKGAVVYFDRNRPNQPRSDTWFGDIQDGFVPEEAMNLAPTPSPSLSTRSAPQPSPSAHDRSAPTVPSPTQNMAGYPPPPSGIPATRGNRHESIDLAGDYTSYYASPGIQTAIRVRTDTVHLYAELLDDHFRGTGTKFFEGTFDPGTTIARGRVLDITGFQVFAGTNSGTYHDDMMGTTDIDHFAVPNHRPFERETLPVYNDVACSLANESNVGAKWAYMRAVVAQRANDMPAAVCWLYTASIQGDARAAFYLAASIHDGRGTTPDAALSLQWALKSGQNGSDTGAYLASYLYDSGDGTTRSPANATYWHQRGDSIKQQRKVEAEREDAVAQQQQREVMVLAGISVVGLAMLTSEMTDTHLCDKSQIHNGYDVDYVRKELQSMHMHCEDGNSEPVSNSRQ